MREIEQREGQKEGIPLSLPTSHLKQFVDVQGPHVLIKDHYNKCS